MDESEVFKILMVEDDRNLALTLAAGIRHAFRERTKVDACLGGQHAQRLLSQDRYQLVLSDFQLPDMTGLELLKQVRAADPEALLVLMTAHGTEELEQQARNLVNAYINKPFDLTFVIELIERLLPTSPTEEPDPTPGGSIAIIEDDPSLRALLAKVLGKAGYEIFQADSMQAANQLMANNSFDLLICDVVLKDGRGTQFLSEQQEALKRDGTKVLMLTGESQHRYEANNLSVDLFLEKPVSIQDLLILISRLVGV